MCDIDYLPLYLYKWVLSDTLHCKLNKASDKIYLWLVSHYSDPLSWLKHVGIKIVMDVKTRICKLSSRSDLVCYIHFALMLSWKVWIFLPPTLWIAGWSGFSWFGWQVLKKDKPEFKIMEKLSNERVIQGLWKISSLLIKDI